MNILNRLKFPILQPTSIRLRERVIRLIAERRHYQAEEKLREEQLKETRNREFATLIGNKHLVFCLVSSAFTNNCKK